MTGGGRKRGAPPRPTAAGAARAGRAARGRGGARGGGREVGGAWAGVTVRLRGRLSQRWGWRGELGPPISAGFTIAKRSRAATRLSASPPGIAVLAESRSA